MPSVDHSDYSAQVLQIEVDTRLSVADTTEIAETGPEMGTTEADTAPQGLWIRHDDDISILREIGVLPRIPFLKLLLLRRVSM